MICWIVFLHSLVIWTTADAFIRPEEVELTDDQNVDCALTGLISAEDCCHFIKCDHNKVGWQFPCLGGTVWDSKLCACVKRKRGETCHLTCPVLPTPGTVAPCPIDLGSDECCLPGSGQLFRADTTNSSQYYFENEDEPQACPAGQIFAASDCCCEGEIIATPQPCILFEYEQNYIDSHQNVHGKPVNTAIVQEGVNSAASFRSQEGGYVEVPYFSNSYFGTYFSVRTYFRVNVDDLLDTNNEGSSFILVHNGQDEGAKATVKMELLRCNGNLYFVAGVRACDRTEDIVMLLNINNNEWYCAFMVFNAGDIMFTLEDGGGASVFSEQRSEPEPLDAQELRVFAQCINSQATQSNGRAMNVANDLQQPESTPEEIAKIREITDCLDQVQQALEDLGDIVDAPEDGIGLTALRRATVDSRKPRNLCRNKKYHKVDFDELATIVDDYRDILTMVINTMTEVRRVLVKICFLLDDKDPITRRVITSEMRHRLKVLKRKLNRAQEVAGEDDGKFSKKLETMEDCLTRRQRRRRDVDSEETPSIQTSKYGLFIGYDFPGNMDQTEICLDEP